MDPHERTKERTRRFPFFKHIALCKPRGSATVMRFAGYVVIYPWIRGRQPTAKVLLAPTTYQVISAHMPRNDNIKRSRTFELVHFGCQFLHQD
jgi:hypothetical protein